ncbi:PTS sugar transporter subunit IIA [Salisediminibacterium beveridgei]|uniref:Ascorbate-specific PTS system EIIA component n=1 Tax=Salisediminibacterium beveridgei TaxID=632773 RepID=A0A1D7QS04_9BACI|nr:PTS sugar transporter subunit IIA [Salisediminibacterium beveridgei]AOM81771.1 phosphotransferase system IIA component [Salisediminibacterium beveridgei]
MSEVKLTRHFIQWEEKAMDWQEAIETSARPLLKQGNIEETYVKAMIQNIIDLGPYILIAPDVALPHARPEKGVNQAGLSLTVFKHPVLFPAGTDEKVSEARLFICLAAVDSESHLGLLQNISGWIDDRSFIEELLNASSEDEVVQLVTAFQENQQ